MYCLGGEGFLESDGVVQGRGAESSYVESPEPILLRRWIWTVKRAWTAGVLITKRGVTLIESHKPAVEL